MYGRYYVVMHKWNNGENVQWSRLFFFRSTVWCINLIHHILFSRFILSLDTITSITIFVFKSHVYTQFRQFLHFLCFHSSRYLVSKPHPFLSPRTYFDVHVHFITFNTLIDIHLILIYLVMIILYLYISQIYVICILYK